MNTERVTVTKTNSDAIEAVRRHWPDHIDYADLCGNVIPEDEIKEVCDAG